MRLIQITDTSGIEQYVNPEFVTSIKDHQFVTSITDHQGKDKDYREVWVIGQSGYHTFSILTKEPASDLAARLTLKEKN